MFFSAPILEHTQPLLSAQCEKQSLEFCHKILNNFYLFSFYNFALHSLQETQTNTQFCQRSRLDQSHL